MRHTKIYIAILLLFTLSGWGLCADQNILKKKFDESLEVTSDRMEAYQDKKLIVFYGHARITQGKSVLKSDRLLLYYQEALKKGDQKSAPGTDQSGNLEKIEAQGSVYFQQENRTAQGDRAVYYRESGKIVITGNALLNEGKNSIRGDRVTVFLNENRGMVESDTQNQVKAVIYPQRVKKTEKEK